jgi:hypothetical protein
MLASGPQSLLSGLQACGLEAASERKMEWWVIYRKISFLIDCNPGYPPFQQSRIPFFQAL